MLNLKEQNENIEQRYNESIQNLNQAQELFNQRGGEILRNFEIQMEDLRRKKEQEFDNQRGEFKRLIEELNNILDHFEISNNLWKLIHHVNGEQQ